MSHLQSKNFRTKINKTKKEPKMKKLLLSIASVIASGAITLQASVEKLATVQVTDIPTIISTATIAGELVGYPIFGTVAAMAISENNPAAPYTGPLKSGSGIALEVYGETEFGQFSENAEAFLDSLALGIIFSPNGGKEGYLAAMKGGVDNGDGTFTVKNLKNREEHFVVFSANGEWAAISDKKDYAIRALADLADAEQAMTVLDGGVVRLAVTPAAMNIVSKAIDEIMPMLAESDPQNAELLAACFDIYKSIESFDVTARLDARGLDFFGAMKPRAGTIFSTIGTSGALGPNPFSAADPNAAYAMACTPNSGFDGPAYVNAIGNIVSFFSENGLKTDWYKMEQKGSFYNMSLDLFGAIAYFTGEGKEASDKLDAEAFLQRFNGLLATCALKEGAPEFGMSCSFPEVKLSATPDQLLARTVPDYMERKSFASCVFSLYAMVKGLAPKFIEMAAPPDEAQMLNMMIAAMPAYQGAMVSMVSREGDSFKYLFRASADEIRGIAAIVNVGVSYFVLQTQKQMSTSFQTLDDDDEDDYDE